MTTRLEQLLLSYNIDSATVSLLVPQIINIYNDYTNSNNDDTTQDTTPVIEVKPDDEVIREI